ncbi:ABZJ_00895 family protein [Albirhodobacter sp. R86504]|jgi:hypothetical protein|uniref:ABZJ_00895 family protein n=1 Tax=Albirhodobacter sp. R86504 TaxID=3093848 RepID=UPI00366F85AD
MSYPRYALVFLIASFAIPVGLWAIERVTGYAPSATILWILPVLCAGMIEGQKFAAATGRTPTGLEAWGFARVATMLAMAISLALAVPLIIFAGGEIRSSLDAVMGDPELRMIAGAVFVFYMLVIFGMNRLFFGMGAKNEMKALARRRG